jgi:hypothetical protein
MLQKLANKREIKIVTGDNNRQRDTKTVTDDLERDVVYVGAMAWQEDERLLLLGRDGSNPADVLDFS